MGGQTAMTPTSSVRPSLFVSFFPQEPAQLLLEQGTRLHVRIVEDRRREKTQRQRRQKREERRKPRQAGRGKCSSGSSNPATTEQKQQQQ